MDENNSVQLTLPVDYQWLNIATDLVGQYARTAGFNQRLSDMVCQSADEALGVIVERARQLIGHYEMTLNASHDDKAITITFTYNAQIPLNPLKEKAYEVPDEKADLDDLNMDSLWLHMIKYRMDRVFFNPHGKQQTLTMVKYLREEGKERQVWVLSLKPCMKEKLNVDVTDKDNNGYCGFIQDFKTGRVIHLGKAELHAVQHFDGKTKVYDIYMDAVKKGYHVSPLTYIVLYDTLVQSDMLQGEGRERTSLEKFMNSIYDLTFVLPNSDQLADRFYRMFKPMFSVAGVILILLFALSAFYPLVTRHEEVVQMYSDSFTLVRNNWSVALSVLLLGSLTFFCHELSHGAACKKYGGKVPRIGITYYLVTFICFCDTTTSYNFPKKLQRIVVSLAGPLSTLLLWSFYVWGFFLFTSVYAKFTCFSLMTATGVSIILNFNPFLRMDGYYMLCDLLGINNLRSKSLYFIKNKILHLFGVTVPQCRYPKKETRWFWFYGVIGTLITVYFCLRPFIRFITYTSHGVNWSLKFFWMTIMFLMAILNLSNRLFRNYKKINNQNFKLK